MGKGWARSAVTRSRNPSSNLDITRAVTRFRIFEPTADEQKLGRDHIGFSHHYYYRNVIAWPKAVTYEDYAFGNFIAVFTTFIAATFCSGVITNVLL